jgi:hypothetical protein
MNWEGFQKERSRNIITYHFTISLERLKKTTNISAVTAENRTPDIQNEYVRFFKGGGHDLSGHFSRDIEKNHEKFETGYQVSRKRFLSNFKSRVQCLSSIVVEPRNLQERTQTSSPDST